MDSGFVFCSFSLNVSLLLFECFRFSFIGSDPVSPGLVCLFVPFSQICFVMCMGFDFPFGLLRGRGMDRPEFGGWIQQ